MQGIVVDPEFDLYSFNEFIDIQTNIPLPVIHLDTQRVYSPDYKFYFEYQAYNDPAHKKAILYNSDGQIISSLKHLPKGETLIWLDHCVILDGGSAPVTKKIVIDLRTGKVKTYSTKYWFMFLGQTNQKAFFASNSDDNKISGKKLPNRHSIISIDEDGVSLVVDNKSLSNSYPDSVYFYDFYNSKFTIRHLKLSNKSDDDKPLKTEFLSENKVVQTPDSMSFYTAYEDSYFLNGDTYVKINGREIYRVIGDSFEKIVDFGESKINGWIRDFKIEGDYLIFKTQSRNGEFYMTEPPRDTIVTANGLSTYRSVYGFNTIGIVNLKTKECTYPVIN